MHDHIIKIQACKQNGARPEDKETIAVRASSISNRDAIFTYKIIVERIW